MIKYDCGCEYNNETEVVAKIIFKGVGENTLPESFEINCSCGTNLEMTTHLFECESCGSVYGVTPCNNTNITKVVKATKEEFAVLNN